MRAAARDIALRSAEEAYDRGNVGLAARQLAIAEKYDRRSPELRHNQAVLMLASGRLDAAIEELRRLEGEVPEALVNLGVAYDKKGDAQRALDYYRRALAAGVRFAPLRGWIDAKERFWGGNP
jgi:tetratricopeptide (TPR) repeat protein